MYKPFKFALQSLPSSYAILLIRQVSLAFVHLQSSTQKNCDAWTCVSWHSFLLVSARSHSLTGSVVSTNKGHCFLLTLLCWAFCVKPHAKLPAKWPASSTNLTHSLHQAHETAQNSMNAVVGMASTRSADNIRLHCYCQPCCNPDTSTWPLAGMRAGLTKEK